MVTKLSLINYPSSLPKPIHCENRILLRKRARFSIIKCPHCILKRFSLKTIISKLESTGADKEMDVEPLGAAEVHYWGPLVERYRLNPSVVNEVVDRTFRFMSVEGRVGFAGSVLAIRNAKPNRPQGSPRYSPRAQIVAAISLHGEPSAANRKASTWEGVLA